MSFMSTAPRPQISPSLSFGAERIHGPLLPQGRHDVQVPVDHEGAGGRVLPRHAGDHAGAAGLGFEDLSVQPHLGDQSGRVFGRRAFPRPGTVPVVGCVDPDEFLADADDFILGPDFSH